MTTRDKMESIEFTQSDGRISELLDLLHEMTDLQSVGALASWDQHTAMPPGAAEVRGHQMAALEGLLHERWTSPRLGKLLDELDSAVKQPNFTDADRGLVSRVRRNYDRATKLPRTLVEEMARVNAASVEAWVKARRQNDFASFAPWLQRTLDLQQEVADRVGFIETRYDALLDDYEPGVAPSLVRTPIAGGASLGVHESQSRLWENLLGRSEPYWEGQYAIVREVFPEHFASVDVATFVRALNKVQPSLIRVEADEVTYNLHIIIRFELEKALVNGEISVESLPALWNAKYRAYLGIEPPNDSDGVLQDMHWSGGFGYFPTYTLGNLYSAQIFRKLRSEFPDFDERLAKGDTSFVLQWLRERLYAFGAIYTPEELITRVTGEAPDPNYFVQYLTSKFEKIYAL